MKVWVIITSILFGIAKLAGTFVVMGFSLGVIVGCKLKGGSTLSFSNDKSMSDDKGSAEGMAQAIETAAERVIKDLEKRTEIAVELLNNAEGKIAGLKDMLDPYDKPVPNKIGIDKFSIDEPQIHEFGPEKIESDKKTLNQEPSVTPGMESRYFQVFKLADEGLNVREIAKKVGIGYGETELILNLKGKED